MSSLRCDSFTSKEKPLNNLMWQTPPNESLLQTYSLTNTILTFHQPSLSKTQ